jgi:predicted porin
MTKKLLPTLIGVALAGGMAAAQADVTVFGHIDESVVNSTDVVNDGYDTNFVCTTCSIGFKGSEDLGNGLKAIFSLDFQYDINNRNNGRVSVDRDTAGNVTDVSKSSDSIIDRDQWLGLAGNFGQVRVGTISTSYKSHGALLDPGYRTAAQMRDWGIQSYMHNGAGENGQGRATNTARYDSPDWNGLKVTATYTLDSNPNDANGDNNPYGGGVEYSNGGLLVFADYFTTDQGSRDEAYKAGAKFTMNNFAVFGQYEVDDGLISQNTPFLSAVGATKGADVWMLGASYTMGNNTLYGSYAQGENADNTNLPSLDTSYDAWNVVGVHSMSKQTLVYLGYGNQDFDDDRAPDPEAWALGMKHKF